VSHAAEIPALGKDEAIAILSGVECGEIVEIQKRPMSPPLILTTDF
jgi:hypothetical protein